MNVAVTDNDTAVTVTCPGPIPDPFAAGDSFTCSATGTATVGQYENIGTASGQTAGGATATDTDASHYLVPTPTPASISLEKATNGADADSPTDPDVPRIPEEQGVVWDYVVTNTGGVAFEVVSVTDDQPGVNPVCPKSSLAVGESMTCQATGTAEDTADPVLFPTGFYVNIGTVTAQETFNSTPITASDPSHYITDSSGGGR